MSGRVWGTGNQADRPVLALALAALALADAHLALARVLALALALALARVFVPPPLQTAFRRLACRFKVWARVATA